MRSLSILIAAPALLLAAGAANAKSVSVSTDAVTWTNVADVADIHRKIAVAAFDACDTNQRVTLQERSMRRACAISAMDQAIAQANIPTLTALHETLDASTRYSRGARELNPVALAAVSAAAEAMSGETPAQVAAR